ncbi:unnamed protein product [Natator depressus]
MEHLEKRSILYGYTEAIPALGPTAGLTVSFEGKQERQQLGAQGTTEGEYKCSCPEPVTLGVYANYQVGANPANLHVWKSMYNSFLFLHKVFPIVLVPVVPEYLTYTEDFILKPQMDGNSLILQTEHTGAEKVTCLSHTGSL